MNALKKLLVVLFTICFVACNTSGSNETKTDSLEVSNDDTAAAESPDKVVIKFLEWYRDNEERLAKIELVFGMQDTTKPYSVNVEGTKTYLAELKKSGFVSDRFLEDLRLQFVKSDDYMKKNPGNDGPPFGFDADLIMQAQDFSDVWQNLSKAELVNQKIEGTNAKLRFKFTEYYKTNYYLSKVGNKWLINRIENSFKDDF